MLPMSLRWFLKLSYSWHLFIDEEHDKQGWAYENNEWSSQWHQGERQGPGCSITAMCYAYHNTYFTINGTVLPDLAWLRLTRDVEIESITLWDVPVMPSYGSLCILPCLLINVWDRKQAEFCPRQMCDRVGPLLFLWESEDHSTALNYAIWLQILKLFAWEPSFEQRIGQIRARELKGLLNFSYLQAFSIFLFTCAPVIVRQCWEWGWGVGGKVRPLGAGLWQEWQHIKIPCGVALLESWAGMRRRPGCSLVSFKLIWVKGLAESESEQSFVCALLIPCIPSSVEFIAHQCVSWCVPRSLW